MDGLQRSRMIALLSTVINEDGRDNLLRAIIGVPEHTTDLLHCINRIINATDRTEPSKEY